MYTSADWACINPQHIYTHTHSPTQVRVGIYIYIYIYIKSTEINFTLKFDHSGKT